MLQLSTVRRKLHFKIGETSLIHTASELLNKNGWILDFNVYLHTKNKNLQRDFCWSLESKSEFILSILKGIRIPNISIILKKYVHENETRDEILQIIDGKQRLSAILDFIDNKFPVIFNGEKYYFNDLDESAQYEIEHGVPLVNIAYEWIYDDGIDNVIISDDEKIAWFKMINFAGTPQDIEHLNYLKS